MKIKDHIFEEAKKVAHLLLEELIDLSDDQEQSINEIEEVTLDEKLDEMHENSAKKYYNKCYQCGFIADATKRYVAVQRVLKHKESCTEIKMNIGGQKKHCSKFDYVVYDALPMKAREG